MKIEKINENQIRCTLTKADLAKRQLKLSELAYGTDKARKLFQEMMAEAAMEFGFEANNIPLMIEAVPVSSETIILLITKVEDPEELDTRFANFGPELTKGEGNGTIDELIKSLTGEAEKFMDLFKKSKKNVSDRISEKNEETPDFPEDFEITKAFSFNSLQDIFRVCGVLKDLYKGKNSIYKNNKTGEYLFVVNKSDNTPENFIKICNVISEYGKVMKYSAATVANLDEHGEVILKDNAIEEIINAGLDK